MIDFFKARTNSEFNIAESYRSYAINDAWKSNTALWNLIGAYAGEVSSKIYERIVDMTKNIADVDICDIRQLESLSYQLGLNHGFGFTSSLPSEIYDLMNILSVKQTYFFAKEGIFTKAGVDSIMDEIPLATEAIAGNSSTIGQAVFQSVQNVTQNMVSNGTLTQIQKNACCAAVGADMSINALESLVYSGNTSEIPENKISESQFIAIKYKVISEILESGKLTYDDYKSSAIQKNSFKDVFNINVKPAIEFTDVIRNNQIEHDYSVNHSISIGTSEELVEFLTSESGSRFKISIWNIPSTNFINLINECDISNTSKSNILTQLTASNGDVSQALYFSINLNLISKDEFSTVVNSINSIRLYDIFSMMIASTGSSILATNMENSEIIGNNEAGAFSSLIDEVGIEKAISIFSNSSRIRTDKFADKNISWLYKFVSYVGLFSDIEMSSGELKLPNNTDAIFVYKNNIWIAFRNLWDKFPGLECVSNDNAKIGSYIKFNTGADTLQLPAIGLVSYGVIGASVKFDSIPFYVGFQTFIDKIIYKSYHDLIYEKLNCVLNAGNETDLSLYKEDFLKYTNESGFNQYVNDRNVNFGFYRALVISNFCSNVCSSHNLSGDWFLDSTLHSTGDANVINVEDVIDDVVRTLCDMNIAVTIRREILKKLAIQYSKIGSNSGTEKVINDFVLRNFTKRNEDWNFASDVAIANDQCLPSLDDIKSKFGVQVTEYFDSNEYLNISAESAKKMEQNGTRTIRHISSYINASGNLATSEVYEFVPYYEETNIPLVSGGNAKFWELPDYSIKMNELKDDIVEFYQNVDGALDNLSSIGSICSVLISMWENCSVSSLSAENLEMHRKYVGDNTGYLKAVNSGNENYPTIAPVESLTNLTEIYGNMDRDYQSVLNDDRPPIVEGVAVTIISAYSCVPVTDDDIGTDYERYGIPPFFTYPPEDYIRNVTGYTEVSGVSQQEVTRYINEQVSSIEQIIRTGVSTRIDTVTGLQLSSWTEEQILNSNTYYAKLFGNYLIKKDEETGSILPIDRSDSTDPYNIKDYTINAILSGTDQSMMLESVTISYSETESSSFDDAIRMNEMQTVYNVYLSSEDLTGVNAITGLSAEFQGLRSSIQNIKVPWYDSNVINESIISAYTTYPITETVQYTYDLDSTAIYQKMSDPSATPTPISSYAQVVNAINTGTSVIKEKLSATVDKTALQNYSDAVIAGRIANTNGSNYLAKYVRWIESSLLTVSLIDQITTLRGNINSKFDVVTANSTIENYESYKAMVNSEISKANEWNNAVTTFYNSYDGKTSTTITNPISACSDVTLSSVFGSEYSRVNKSENEVTPEIELVTVKTINHNTVTAMIPVTSYNQVQVNWRTIDDSVVWNTVQIPETSYVDVSFIKSVPVVSQVTAYKIINSDQLNYKESETPEMFDIYGGLINSWRNVNVELRGYQSCYEASPNLNVNYSENKYVDVDGPWIGEALYDLLYQIIPLSGATIQSQIVTPDPIPSDIDVVKLKEEHRYNVSNGNKNGKWWLPEYVEKLEGHDLSNQLEFYVDKIVECRNKSIFEIEVDSFNNQYTLFKNKSETNKYDSEGVLWMRHDGFPFSFPIMENAQIGWDDHNHIDDKTITNEIGVYHRSISDDISNDTAGKLFAWRNDSLNPSLMYTQDENPAKYSYSISYNVNPEVKSKIIGFDLQISQESLGNKIDQIYLGYTMNFYRSIFNRCLAFGVNNTTLWAAGYDGRNEDGSNHFNIRITQLKYSDIDGKRYYGTRNPKTMNKFNSDPVGYNENSTVFTDLNDQYSWIDFCGGYYDGNVINFVFYGNSGFRFRIYNLNNARLNYADIIAEFDDKTSKANYAPTIVSNHNPFRLVEDNDYCYIGWVSGNKVVICQNDKKNYTFSSCLAWNIPVGENSREIDAIVAGTETTKIKMKSGNVYYGRISGVNFSSNSGVDTLIPYTSVKMNYVVDDEDDTNRRTEIPVIPIIDITQWRHWGYSLTTNSLYTISYADALNVKSETSAAVSRTGYHYNVMSKKTYIPGNLTNQSIVSYDPYSGINDDTGVDILTGYSIGSEFIELTPYLQTVINAYAPMAASAEIVPADSEYDMMVIANSEPKTLSNYYGLPYNNLYVERTDLEDNRIGQNDLLKPRSEYNFLVLKNFYNYAYEHEYNWNNAVIPYDKSSLDKIVGWRKYLRCSISRYSDSMWMSYNYIRDYRILLQSNKQQSVAYIMNDFEFVEVVYGTIQLMNTNYNKASVFSISINNSELNKPGYVDNSEESATLRKNARKQIKEEIREMIDNYSPAHMQLWKIDFKN